MRPMITGLTVLVTAVVGLTACGSTSDSGANSSVAASPTAQHPTSLPGQEGSSMQIRLRIGGRKRPHGSTTTRPPGISRPCCRSRSPCTTSAAARRPVRCRATSPMGRARATTAPVNSVTGPRAATWPSTTTKTGSAFPSPGIVMIGEIETGLDTITDADDNATVSIAAA